MRRHRLVINDVDYTEQCTALSWQDYVSSVGRFDAKLVGTHDIIGFQKVKIYDDDKQVFQGRIASPIKENVPGGSGMPIGGQEWTARLKDYLTRHVDLNGESLTDSLTEMLYNSPYSVGTVDDIDAVEVEQQVYDNVLEFLPFTYTKACIAYKNEEYLTKEALIGNFNYCDANRRMCFYSKATGYFYALFYDNDTSLFSYTSTADFVTWKAVTSLGYDKGSGGGYGLWWDEANSKLYVLVSDGTNIDYYRYSEAGGTLTQEATQDDICEGDLICGPMLDDAEQIHFIVEDTTETDYELWEGTADAVWAERVDWAVADNDDPKYMFYGGDDDDDIIVIMWDDDNNDIEEWLYDATAATITFQRKIDDINNTDCGYVTGFQDHNGNMYVVWEDEHAGGDADLYFSSKELLNTPELGWTTPIKLVDDDDYQTMNNISLSGDNAGNLYLFYVYDDGTTAEIRMIRRFEETWETDGTAFNTVNATASSNVRSPAEGQALFASWRDAGADCHASLFSMYGVVSNRDFFNPDEEHNYENGLDFDFQWINTNCKIDWLYNNWYTGLYSVKCTVPAAAGFKYATGGYYVNEDALFARVVVEVNPSGIDDNGDAIDVLLFDASGAGVMRLGWEMNAGTVEWRLRIREGAAYQDYFSGTTPVEDTTYIVEVYWVNDGVAGACHVWIDDVLTLSSTGIDTADYGNVRAVHAGARGYNIDTESVVYIDDLAISNRRIGAVPYGNVRTDLYTASAAFNDWGTLDSTDADSRMTWWRVYDNVPTLLTSNFRVPRDMEAAGVANTDDPIYVQVNLEDPYISDRIYVKDIRINEKQGLISMPLDYERSSTAVKKTADIVGREYKLGWDDILDMVENLGEDKSETIILKTAKTKLYPHIKPNIISVTKEPDFENFANAIKVLGYGDYPDRYEGSAQDEDSIATYGIHWLPLTNKDCITNGMCNTYAATQVAIRKDPVERIEVEFYDDYGAGDISVGTKVWIVDDETGLNQSARIIALSFSWDVSSGRKMSASLINRMKAMDFLELLANVEDLNRWI